MACLFQYLGLARPENLVKRLEPLNRQQRLSLLVASAQERIVPTLINNRYIAIAVMLNLPGNAILHFDLNVGLIALQPLLRSRTDRYRADPAAESRLMALPRWFDQSRHTR
jgi:hypothetical protein